MQIALADKGFSECNNSHAGYFIRVDVLTGCAAKTVRLSEKAGVKPTPSVTIRLRHPISEQIGLLRRSFGVTSRHEFLKLRDFIFGDASENICEPGLGIDAV